MALSLVTTLPLSAEIKALDVFTEKLEKRDGLFPIFYQQEKDKVFVQINRLDQPFLFQSSLPQGVGSNDIGLDRGQLGDTRIVKFERYGNKVMLKQLNTQYRVNSQNSAEHDSIDEAFADSVIAGFKVVAEHDGVVLIDYTDFLFSDIHGISQRLDRTKQGKYKQDKNRSGVYLARTKSFERNTELEAMVTFGGQAKGQYIKQVTPDPDSVTVHLHHSLIALPEEGYKTREFHPFSGFWEVSYQDYGVAIEDSMEQSFIPRHRLHKKDPSAQMSEAVEPIVYYLDPGIPEPVKSALYDGAMWWNQAFEAIGYKDAFQVKVLPADADPMDVRYNVIQWVHRATRGWSYGSSVIDPRNGEIIKGHVTLGSLRVRQDYLIALGLTSPFSTADTSTEDQKQMALARIRQLSAHEVGHTLGIAHNFAASVNDRASVMDYPHPYVRIVNNKISLEGAYAVDIGAWDKHVIAYGYQDFADKSQESALLSKMISDTRNKGLLYLSDPDSRSANHATDSGHLWDNGKDPVSEFERISKVRELALSNFGINTLKEGDNLSSLQETLVPIYALHRYQLDAVAKLLGGVSYEYEQKGDYAKAKGVQTVSSKKQKQALSALLQSMSFDYLSLSESLRQLITPKAYGEQRTRESFKSRTGITFDPTSLAEAAAGYSLKLLFSPVRLNRLSNQHYLDSSMPGVNLVVEKTLEQTIKARKGKGDYLHDRLSYLALNALINVFEDKSLAPEAKAMVQFQLIKLEKWLNRQPDDPQHLVMASQLAQYWQTGKWLGKFDVLPLPPGSPI